jgi:signal transduction histidine kinase
MLALPVVSNVRPVKSSKSAVLFALVVTLCVAEVGWWIVFQFRETARLERAARLLEAGDVPAAARVLGAEDVSGIAEEARRRRFMFATEGAALGLCVMIGVVFFYAAMLRERRLRRDHERFLTGATHELKTPLATVRLGLESLQSGRTSADRVPRYLGSMLREVDRLERGLSNLLLAAGLRRGGHEPKPTPGDLAADTRALVDEMRERFAAAGLRVEVDAPGPCPLERDPTAVRTIVHNLLDNAAKFSNAGGQVRVRVADVGDAVEIAVADDGHGMDEVELRHAFEPLWRGRERDHVGGSGVGLYLVAELVDRHGGTVTADSAGRGRGTEFRVRLPKESR